MNFKLEDIPFVIEEINGDLSNDEINDDDDEDEEEEEEEK